MLVVIANSAINAKKETSSTNQLSRGARPIFTSETKPAGVLGQLSEFKATQFDSLDNFFWVKPNFASLRVT